jgi:hypothetical protein
VVRYTVVVKSPAGAETVSFEGMRCESGERKLYAFGRADGQGGGEWSRNRYARWDVIKGRQQTGLPQGALLSLFLRRRKRRQPENHPPPAQDRRSV